MLRASQPRGLASAVSTQLLLLSLSWSPQLALQLPRLPQPQAGPESISYVKGLGRDCAGTKPVVTSPVSPECPGGIGATDH